MSRSNFNCHTEYLPLVISSAVFYDILTKFGNPTEVLSARNEPFDKIHYGGGLHSLSAFSSLFIAVGLSRV